MNGDAGLAPGSVLAGRYEIASPLGQGGTAFVYRGRDLVTGGDVAVKVLKRAVTAALGTERFIREIGIAGSLDHLHILPLLDSGDDHGALFYVMPIASGQTLREKIDRDGQLTLEEVVRVALALASALAYAHGRGIVHRDIKPSNVLLDGDRLYLADFGLARAIHHAADEVSLTTSGIVIGTPSYMAPEQSSAAMVLDGRADIYALGCVLYEMLCGDPPFTGSTTTTILLRHQTHPVQPVRTLRPAIPAWLDAIVLRCLEKVPADRYQRAEDLVTALDVRASPNPESAGTHRRRGRFATTALVALGLAVLFILGLVWRPGSTPARSVDTTRIAVLPASGDVSPSIGALHLRLGDALTRWTGVRVADRQRVTELVTQPDLSLRQSAEVANRLEAGRFVRLEVQKSSDRFTLRAGLYDAAGQGLLYEVTAGPSALTDSVLAQVADSLLFRGRAPSSSNTSHTTRSATALQAYLRGMVEVGSWDLDAADQAFTHAVAADSGYFGALLWLALVRSWRGLAPSQWRFHADRAVATGPSLPRAEATLALALAAQARGDFAGACPALLDLARTRKSDFAAWYSAAACLDADAAVVRSRASPTGWAFRSSYQQALMAWRNAFALHPGIYRDYRHVEARRRAWHLWISPNQAREGYAIPPHSGAFMALPSWEGDSLAFLPRPARDFSTGSVFGSRLTEVALQRQRQSFLQLATEWVAADPVNIEAREALAISLWMVGSEAAVDSVAAARAMARSEPERARLGLIHVMMLLLRRAPEPEDADRAGRLADSLLRKRGPDWDPHVVATLAAITGQVGLAAEIGRVPGDRTRWRLPPVVVGKGLSLLIHAAGGGPVETLSNLEADLSRGIAAAPESEQLDLKLEWLGRPSVLAFPAYRFRSLAEMAGHDDYLVDAWAAHLNGADTAVMAALSRAKQTRAWMRPADVPFEALLPEATLLAESGAHTQAIRLIDPTLSELHHAPIRTLLNPVAALLMIRTFALRAELAARSDEPVVARRWSGMVARMWSNPDPFLTPIRGRMRSLERGTSP